MSKHLVSVIIPYFGNWTLTHQRLGELSRYAPADRVEVILVNDASTELDCRSGAGWWTNNFKDFPVRYVENKNNLGFGGSNNIGAKVAKGDILVFLSNDVVVSGKFIEQIEEIIDSYDGEVMIGNQVLYHDTGWNVITIKDKPSIICYPVGYLLACTRKLWNRIGGFDLLYGVYDYEDVDLGAWCIYNDVPMIALNNPGIRHMGEQTVRKVNPNREEHTKKNRVLFIDKWTDLLAEKYK